jgi:hypothetical protein
MMIYGRVEAFMILKQAKPIAVKLVFRVLIN